MNEKTRKRWDSIQNLIIALLAVSAVLLFTQMYRPDSSGYWQLFDPAGAQAPSGNAGQSVPLTAPVHAVVTGPYGRFGSVTMTTSDEAFSPLRSLLEQALGSARSGASCEKEEFLQALDSISVYCDFLAPLPLTVLADLMWTSGGDETVLARQVAVVKQADAVMLFLWDGKEQFLRCETALTPDILESTVERYESGSAQFAMDTLYARYPDLAPCSLFLEEEPVLPVLSSVSALEDSAPLMTALGFNPNAQNRYPDAKGTQVIMENGRTLRIYTDGTVTYRSGGSDLLSISAEGEVPTLLEASLGCGTLLNTLLSSVSGDSTIWLKDIRQNGDSTTLHFGYQSGGVPVRFSDGGHAASITLSGTAVSSLTLRVRQYTAQDETSLLLPLPQALAVSAQYPGRELTLSYVDNGTDSVSVQWLAA